MSYLSQQKGVKTHRYLKYFSLLAWSIAPLLSQSQEGFVWGGYIGYSDDAGFAQVADLNSDGSPDAVWMSALDRVFWSPGNGSGGFGNTMDIDPPFMFSPDHFDLGDVDNDGDLDVILIGNGMYETIDQEYLEGEQIWWSANNGSGGFDFPEFVHLEETSWGGSVEVQDMDNDGLADIIASYQGGDKIAVYLNQGGGSFGGQLILGSAINGPEDVHIANLVGGDGFPEVISGMGAGYGVYYWENSAGVEYNPINFPGSMQQPRKFTAGDLDGDGDNDVLVARSNSLHWFRNLGGGSFSASIQIGGSVGGITSIVAADMDLDGDLDIVVGFNLGVRYYENNGSATFTNFYDLDVVNVGTYVAVSAVNSNSFPDIMCAQPTTGDVFWIDNINYPGCTDIAACNYNELAVADDGSCCYTVCGCTNPLASNYDTSASCGNGSCLFELSGFVFNDLNSNGIWDGGEPPLALQQVNLPALSLTSFTNDEGMFLFTVGEGEFEILLVDNPLYPFNTTPATLVIDTDSDVIFGHLFGRSIEAPQFAICVDFYPSGNGFLCDDILNFNICFRNMGNVPVDGVVEVEYDPLFQGYIEQTPISNVDGNTVYMNFQDLQPGEMYFYDLGLYTPTVEFIGEYVTSTARVSGYINDALVAYGEAEHTLEVTCAYDPNDKRVFPEGYTEDHLILNEGALDFQVRFQNTGNAPATDVLIRDTLDANLDISTFMLMANTHSVIITVNSSTREVTFLFLNIQLPDSTCCEEDSHGFVSYMIHPLADLDAGTVISNTAYIYFDNNPPIVTNTTWNTIHECDPSLSISGELIDQCPAPVFEVSSDYDQSINWETDYAWMMYEEMIGAGSTIQLNPNYPGELPLQLVATNPLCVESGTETFGLDMGVMWTTCYGDTDCNSIVGVNDLIAFMGEYGCGGPACLFDLDGDFMTGFSDLLLLLSWYGAPCTE